MVTAETDHPADAERDSAIRCFKKTCVVSLNGQTTRMSTGTGKPVKL